MNKGETGHLKTAFKKAAYLTCLLTALIPFLYLVNVAVEYSVDVPTSDDWRIVPLLERSYRGTLTANDFLIADSHPHRITVPRLIMLASARLTGWNLKYQYLINILLGVGIFSIIIAQLKITAGKISRTGACWLIPVISVLVFSVSQWQNWFWGWQICIFLNVLAVIASVYLLSHSGLNRGRFFSAAGCALIATFSFANGLLYWPIALFLIGASPVTGARKRRFLGIWSLIGLGTVLLYLYCPPRLSGAGLRSHGSLLFVFRYLGTPLVRFGFGAHFEWEAALYIGMLSLLLAIVLIILLLRVCRVPLYTIASWISLILYSIGSAFLTSLGRHPKEAVSSRYVTISSLYWIAGIVLLLLLLRHRDAITKSKLGGRVMRFGVVFIVAVIAVMAAYQSLENARVFRSRALALRDARDRLARLNYGDYSILSHRSLPIRELIFLKRHQLSVFRER